MVVVVNLIQPLCVRATVIHDADTVRTKVTAQSLVDCDGMRHPDDVTVKGVVTLQHYSLAAVLFN